jgi:hypothetical protein
LLFREYLNSRKMTKAERVAKLLALPLKRKEKRL